MAGYFISTFKWTPFAQLIDDAESETKKSKMT